MGFKLLFLLPDLGAVLLADEDVVVAPNLKPPLLDTTGVFFGLIAATVSGLLSTGLEVVSILVVDDAANPNFTVATETASDEVILGVVVDVVVALISPIGLGAPNLKSELAALPYLKFPLSSSVIGFDVSDRSGVT